ncbi:MAG: hypothetical protein CL903_03240 [Dehalococcoidia bacterium]|nr:hypothetical protein [Dehalococcoidia bacterium]
MDQHTITLIRDLLIIVFVLFAFFLLLISTFLWVKIYKKINKIFIHADNAKNGINDVVKSVNTSKNLFNNSSSLKSVAGAFGFGAILLGFSRIFKK